MEQETNTHRDHALTVAKVVSMARAHELRREHFLNRARLKFLGSAGSGGLTVAGGVALAIGQGKVEGPAGAWVAAETIFATCSVSLFGFGLSDKSEADDASRKSASLQGALALEERNAGHLIGRGSHHYEDEVASNVIAASVAWGNGEPPR